MSPRALAVLCLALGACVRPSLVPPAREALDVVLVPGCPTREDGGLSRCQMERALSAAALWREGRARHLVVSGAAVHGPHEEATSLAMALAALGVPAEAIYLDRHALHTDENAFGALLIARANGWRSLGVVSQAGHAKAACAMLSAWGQPCAALPTHRARANALHRSLGEPLLALRVPRAPDFVPLAERERLRAERTGRRRPPSYAHYLWLLWLGANGQTWAPDAPSAIEVVSWDEARQGGAPRLVPVSDPLAGRVRASPATAFALGIDGRD